MDVIITILPLIIGWTLDMLIGDPAWLPHPVVGFGKAIGKCEKRFNNGNQRFFKGGVTAGLLILTVFSLTWLLMYALSTYTWVSVAVEAVLISIVLPAQRSSRR